jgi:hypothetical protein
LLVAIFLFGLVMTAMTGVFISATRSVGGQRLRAAATRVATDRLETLRALPFDELDAEAGTGTAPSPDQRSFTVLTEVARIDPDTGAPALAGELKQVTVKVGWTFKGVARDVSYTTAIAPQDSGPVGAAQAISTVTMFPSPAVTDAGGRLEQDVDVTVVLDGFAASTLVHVSWSNADGTARATTLTSATGVTWRGTIPRDQLQGAIGANGLGELEFTVSAGSAVTVYTLALQQAVVSPPAITAATIDRSPIIVANAARNRTCSSSNQCQNTTDVVFSVTATGLDATQDSVILQIQLHDGTFQEAPLTPTDGTWRLTIRQRTTKFRTGAARVFRFTATRSADGATASSTVLRDVVSV